MVSPAAMPRMTMTTSISTSVKPDARAHGLAKR
jgi:hypothetical protein